MHCREGAPDVYRANLELLGRIFHSRSGDAAAASEGWILQINGVEDPTPREIGKKRPEAYAAIEEYLRKLKRLKPGDRLVLVSVNSRTAGTG